MLSRLEQKFREFFPKRLLRYRTYQQVVRGKKGLEIGGPSPSFTLKGFLPLYDLASSIDGCNFSNDTVWEGKIEQGFNYQAGSKIGLQYIDEATDLKNIISSNYDFILSCHSLEHIANPIKALTEWKRVLKDDGYLIVVLPHKDITFDRNRPLTTLEHLIEDYKTEKTEYDETHLEEVIDLHDLTLDSGVLSRELLRVRSKDNYNNRCIHHHVFNTPLVASLANYMHFQILDLQVFSPYNIVALLQKKIGSQVNNSVFLNRNSAIYQSKKFPSDRI